MKNFEEKTVHTQHIFEGQVISVQVDDVVLPNGKTSQRELVKHPGAVGIIPFHSDGRMVLVRQFRKALEKEIYEIPAGKLEKGEEPIACAARELEEETGFQAEQLTQLNSFYTSPGFANEKIYLFEANGLKEGQVHPDEDEFVENVLITLEEGLAMVNNEHIHDAKTAYAILYWQNKSLLQLQLGK